MLLEPEKYLEGLSDGVEPIIKKVYDGIFPNVLTFVKRNKGTKEDAQDIFQKALMQIIARYKIRPFVIQYSFEAYFFTVCKNLWRKELQKQKNRVTNANQTILSNKAEEMALDTLNQEKWGIFNEKFEELSKNCKLILKDFFNKVPYEEIMRKMSYTSNNVLRQRIYKCKKKLTELIVNDTRYKSLKK